MSKVFDLEDRTAAFAANVRIFIRRLKQDIANIEDSKQLVRASGSVGANYIEANEALSKKDFIFRIKICRKEVKESRYWLSLIHIQGDSNIEQQRIELIQESSELLKIFSSIIAKTVVKENPV